MGLSATEQVQITLDGDDSLRKRPNAALAEALRRHGALVNAVGDRAPLVLTGPLKDRNMTVDGSVTSQFGSSLLIALSRNVDSAQLRFSSDRVSAPYFEMTRRMLRLAGVDWEASDDRQTFTKASGQSIVGVGDYTVEGDWSSAAFMCVASVLSRQPVQIDGLAVNGLQGDAAVVQILRRFGQTVTESLRIMIHPQPVVSPYEIDLQETPRPVSTLMYLVRVCSVCGSPDRLPAAETQRVRPDWSNGSWFTRCRCSV